MNIFYLKNGRIVKLYKFVVYWFFSSKKMTSNDGGEGGEGKKGFICDGFRVTFAIRL